MKGLLRRIKWYSIFFDFMRTFFISCSIMFLLLYFDWNPEKMQNTYTFDGIKEAVGTLTIILFATRSGIQILINPARWIEETSNQCKQEIEKEPVVTEQESFDKQVAVVHEAGHTVMSYLTGRKILYVEVGSHKGHTFGHTVLDCRFFTGPELHNLVLNYYAGAIAEQLVYGYFHDGSMSIGGAKTGDFHSATDAIKAYIVQTDPQVSKSLLDAELSERIISLSKEWWKEAEQKLTPMLPAIQRLADALEKKNYLSEEEVVEIINQERRNEV